MIAAQAYLCCELQEPHRAKQERRKIFNEYYHRVFDDKKSDLAYKLYLSYIILDYVLEKQWDLLKEKRRTKRLGKRPRYTLKHLIIAHGSYHIATNVYEGLIAGKSLDAIKKLIITNTLPKNIENTYMQAVSDWEKNIKKNKIDKDNLAQYYKRTGKIF